MAILNKSLRLRGKPERSTGDKKYGAPGGSRESAAFVASYAVADRAAADLGLDREHAHRFLIGLGRTIQKMLLEGDVVGIPFLGCLANREYRKRVNTVGLRAAARARGIERAPVPNEGEMAVARLPYLHMAEELRIVFKDNAIYRGDWREMIAEKRAGLKRRLRLGKRGGNGRALLHTKEGPIMETHEIKKKTPPGMMVEDANAVVDTAETGQQTVRKVADRAAEADRQGKDESAL